MDKIVTENKSNKAIYRAVNDFVHVSKDTKGRTPIEMAMKETLKNHLNYY